MEVRLRPAAAESSDPRSPAAVLEIPDAFAADQYAFGLEEPTLQGRVASKPPKSTGRRDHAMAGDVPRPAVSHDVADGARGARPSGELGDVAVGGDLPHRDTPHGGEDAGGEVGHIC